MINCKLLILLVVVDHTLCNENIALVQYSNPFYELVLCRNCGYNLSNTKHIISKSSPKSQYSFYDTVFSNEDIFVQTFLANLFFEYPVIISTESSCTGIGEWEESSWFAGYISRPCICPECGAFIGWVFQPSDIRLHSSEIFFGIILPNVVGETCKYKSSKFLVIGLWEGFCLCLSPTNYVLFISVDSYDTPPNVFFIKIPTLFQ